MPDRCPVCHAVLSRDRHSAACPWRTATVTPDWLDRVRRRIDADTAAGPAPVPELADSDRRDELPDAS